MSKRNNKHSCGLALYRYTDRGTLELFLCQSNSLRYAHNPDRIAWGFPKGGREHKESLLQTAKREFQEEIGVEAPDIEYQGKIEVVTDYGKKLTIFTGDATDKDVCFGIPETVRREWPIGSGNFIMQTEIRAADWFSVSKAKQKVMRSQKEILSEILKKIKPSDLNN